MVKRVTALPEGDVADPDDTLLMVRGGVTQQVPAGVLPVSGPTANALAAKVDAATVQQQVASAVAAATPKTLQDLSGSLPAASVTYNNQALSAVLAAMQQQINAVGSGNAPIVTSAPTIGGSAAVLGTLNVTLGGVTNGVSGSHTNELQWNLVTGSGDNPISGQTGSSFTIPKGYKGAYLTVTQWARDPLGFLSQPKTSAAVGPVTAVTPTNTTPPAITPSGSQPKGTSFSLTGDVWSNATGATDLVEWLLNGVVVGSGATYLSLDGQEGGTLTARKKKIGTQDDSVFVTSSNSVTITGTATLSGTAPAFPATVQVGVDAPITPSVWTGGTPDALKYWEIFVVEGVDGVTQPYAVIGPATSAIYQPLDDPYMRGKTGLQTLAGKNVRVRERVTLNGVTYYSAMSASKTVTAASTALVATINIPTVNVTQGVPFGSIIPVVASGGNGGPYTYSYNPGPGIVITGVSYSPSTGAFSGTAANPLNITVNITVSDGVNTPVTVSIRFVSTAQTVTIPTIARLNAGDQFSTMDGYVQMLGSSRALNSVSETTGVTGTGTIVGPNGATSMRFGKVADPLNASRQVFFMAAKNTDPATYGHAGRVEMGPNQVSSALVKSGTTYWFAFELYIPTSRFAVGAGNLFQVHNSTPPSTVFGPFALLFAPAGGEITPNAAVLVNTAWSSQSDPSLAGYNDNEAYPWFSNNPGFLGSTAGNWPVNTWVKMVFKYKGDPTGGTGSLTAWMDGTQIMSVSNVNLGTAPQGYPSDYAKIGFDDYEQGGGASGAYQLVRSLVIAQDAGWTEAQIRALLT